MNCRLERFVNYLFQNYIIGFFGQIIGFKIAKNGKIKKPAFGQSGYWKPMSGVGRYANK